MKRVKFTLGLALALIMISANFVNAAKELYRSNEGSSTSIGYSFTVLANPHYVSVESWLRDHSWDNDALAVFPGSTMEIYLHPFVILPISGIDINKENFSALIFGKEYYYGTPSLSTTFISYGRQGFVGTATLGGVYSLYDHNYNLYNDIIIELSFTEGIEVMPVVKRTIVVGEWYYANDDNDVDVQGDKGKGNRMDPTNVEIVDYLLADSVTFRPIHDRGDGVARYVFQQDIQEMFSKYPIFSVSYEVSVHDEIGTLGQEAYEPPMMIEPENMRGLTFDIGAGITTNIPINTIGNTLFVPSNKHYIFTVFSDKEIDATSNRSNDPYDGISVAKDKTQANAYLVTVKRVQSNFSVKVVQKSGSQSGTGEAGTTGNDGAATDAVWGANSTLYVNAATPGLISIYGSTGMLYKTEFISGSYTLPMPKGAYIVQFNGKSFKVVL